MTINLTSAVKSIEIDNRIAGLVTGRIELDGQSEAIELTLEGDCWSDLAGSKLIATAKFETKPWPGDPLPVQIQGLIGDCTSSRRSRPGGIQLSDYDNPDDPDRSMQVFLSLEWFSDHRQRYLIESGDFHLNTEDHQWFMEPADEVAQKMANQQAMRDYVKIIVDPPGTPPQPPPEATDEEAWEVRLQRSDRLNDAYQEVLAKYADDSDSETKEAFVMDWDELLGSLANESEKTPNPISGDFTFSEADWVEGEFIGSDESNFEDEIEIIQHPLQRTTHKLITQYFSPLNELYDKVSADKIEAFYNPFIRISGQLGAALNDDAIANDPGYSLAVLKRCSNLINEALSALPAIAEDLGTSRSARLRHSLSKLQEDILKLRKEIKNDDA